MTKGVITTSKIAPPVGPFSPAVVSDGLLYLSGQVAQDPANGKLISGDTAEQTDQILRNTRALLQAAGKGLTDVLKVGVFLTEMGDFPAMNAVYGQYFEAPYPARTTVGVVALPLGAKVEMDFIAR